MLRLLALGFGVGFGWAGWRNLPPVPNHYAGAFGTLLAAGLLAAYFAGTRRKRDVAVAHAVAKAEARAVAAVQATTVSQASVFVNLDPSLGARRAGEAALSGLDSAPWMVGAAQRVEIDETVDAVQSMLDETREGETA